MERKRVFRSGVVLIELMAAILIFALAGAVCVQVLMKADALATEARNLTDGVNLASSAAEILTASESHEEAQTLLLTAWPQAELEGETVTVPFENGALSIRGELTRDLRSYTIRYLVSQTEIYTLHLVCGGQEVNP